MLKELEKLSLNPEEEEAEESDLCVICQDTIQSGKYNKNRILDKKFELKCMHDNFHWKCLRKWLG